MPAHINEPGIRCPVARDAAKELRAEASRIDDQADLVDSPTAREMRLKSNVLRSVARVIEKINRKSGGKNENQP